MNGFVDGTALKTSEGESNRIAVGGPIGSSDRLSPEPSSSSSDSNCFASFDRVVGRGVLVELPVGLSDGKVLGKAVPPDCTDALVVDSGDSSLPPEPSSSSSDSALRDGWAEGVASELDGNTLGATGGLGGGSSYWPEPSTSSLSSFVGAKNGVDVCCVVFGCSFAVTSVVDWCMTVFEARGSVVRGKVVKIMSGPATSACDTVVGSFKAVAIADDVTGGSDVNGRDVGCCVATGNRVEESIDWVVTFVVIFESADRVVGRTVGSIVPNVTKRELMLLVSTTAVV